MLFARQCLKEIISRRLSQIRHAIYLSIFLFLSLPLLSSTFTFLVLVSAISHDFIKTRAILPWKCRCYQINCSALARRCDLFGSFPLHVSTCERDYCRRNPFVGIITGLRKGNWYSRRLNNDATLSLSWYNIIIIALKKLIIIFNIH